MGRQKQMDVKAKKHGKTGVLWWSIIQFIVCTMHRTAPHAPHSFPEKDHVMQHLAYYKMLNNIHVKDSCTATTPTTQKLDMSLVHSNHQDNHKNLKNSSTVIFMNP